MGYHSWIAEFLTRGRESVLKDGKILQADYNTLMAAAKKGYEATLKKPKQSGVKVSAGDRQEDSAHAALLTLCLLYTSRCV